MWTFLDKFNLLTGFFLFFITLINFCFTWRINRKINSAVDLQRLKLDKEQILGTLDSITRKLEVDERISKESKTRILIVLTDLRASYPDIVKIHKNKLLKRLETDKLNYIETIEQLKRLMTEIERIV
ncbi:hypothetical protein IGK61_001008 [Enterococcus sp. AZ063]